MIECGDDRFAEGETMRRHATFRRWLPAVAVVTLLLAGQVARAADALVTLEVATEPGFAATEARAWSEMLGQAGFSSVRIRGANVGDRPTLETGGTEASPAYRVIGVLTSDGQLVLPRGRFRVSDRGRIEQWLAKLREGGEEGITVKPEAFGLLPRQLVAVHEALAVPVRISTAGQKPRDVAKHIADGLSLKFTTDAVGQRALAVDEPVLDELQGLSSGTALAAVLRPLGLVLVPERAGGEVKLRIADSRAAREHWPVGWPPPKTPGQTLPELFKYLNVEIASVPASEAIEAIAGRVKVPVLIDQNSLARADLDLDVKVDHPRTNTFYARALDRILIPSGLKWELRVDEASKPFLWITTRQ
jgi:hypothetical protein